MSYDRRIPLKSDSETTPVPRRDFVLPDDRWKARGRKRRLRLHLVALCA